MTSSTIVCVPMHRRCRAELDRFITAVEEGRGPPLPLILPLDGRRQYLRRLRSQLHALLLHDISLNGHHASEGIVSTSLPLVPPQLTRGIYDC